MNITEYQKKVHENIVNELRSSNIVRLYGAIGSGKTELVNRFLEQIIHPISHLRRLIKKMRA